MKITRWQYLIFFIFRELVVCHRWWGEINFHLHHILIKFLLETRKNLSNMKQWGVVRTYMNGKRRVEIVNVCIVKLHVIKRSECWNLLYLRGMFEYRYMNHVEYHVKLFGRMKPANCEKCKQWAFKYGKKIFRIYNIQAFHWCVECKWKCRESYD